MKVLKATENEGTRPFRHNPHRRDTRNLLQSHALIKKKVFQIQIQCTATDTEMAAFIYISNY